MVNRVVCLLRFMVSMASDEQEIRGTPCLRPEILSRGKERFTK